MRNIPRALIVGSAFLFAAGCGAATNTTPTTTNTTTTTANSNTNTVVNSNETVNANANTNTDSVKAADYAFGMDYPLTATTAKANETILAPSRAFVDSAIANGADDEVFIFYDATMDTPGENASVINTVFDTGLTMPNPLVIPIPANQTAAVGDVVLTWWQSGSGMQRAIVVAGGTPEQPMVRYLDLGLDNPAKNSAGVPIAEAEEQLDRDSFYVLNSEFQVGSTVAYPGDYGDYNFGYIVNMADDKMLVMSESGHLTAIDKTEAVAVPIKPSFAVGDAVQVAVYGSFSDGTVTKVDAEHGRVYVEYDFAGGKETEAAPYGNVVTADAF